MKNILTFFASLCFIVALILLLPPTRTHADELDDINKELADLTDALNKSIAATKPLESELISMQKKIEDIKGKVAGVEQDIGIKQREIDKGYKDLTEKEKIISHTIRDFYVTSYYNSPFLIFFSLDKASEITQTLAYQRAKTDKDKALITNLALEITDLERKKQELETEQQWLVATKTNLDKQSQKLDETVKGAKAYQQELSGKIASLSEKQQSILNARSGGFTASIGSSELADDYNASIKGFREAAPGGSFAIFSFGAYTHRKGMSQYGARGRAAAGQDYKQILKAYYGKEPVNKDTGGNITVSGYGEMDFETTYLYGIAEMPSSWNTEALKAQAVAARTYAYRYKQDGKEICVTESCQVFNKSKSDTVPDSWKNAVEATKGEVLEDVTTYFASTHGGYANPVGWDTTDGSGGSNFLEKSWDSKGGSPWVYKAWYTKGYSPSSDKCGRSNPWLSSTDMADIINAVFVLYNGGQGSETERVTPITTSCWGGNPYSQDELRQVSEKYGGGVNSVSGVSVSQGEGTTNQVVFQTNKGEKKISGSDFKTAFNIRASGYLSIPQSGFAFFNIEHK